MPELLKAMRQMRIKTKQTADPDTKNSASVVLSFPKRRTVFNVTRHIQD